MMKRKEFLKTSALAMGSIMMGCKSSKINGVSPFFSAINFDMHAHPGRFFADGSEMTFDIEAWKVRVAEMVTLKVNGFFSLVADLPLLRVTDTGVVFEGTFDEDEGWQEYKRQLAILKNLLDITGVNLASSSSDLESDGIHAFISCEGGDFIGQDLNHVSEAYEDGIRSIQLVHYAPNLLGDLQTWKAEHGGLSKLGIAVVKEMNRLGMVIDVAHASMRTVKMVVDQTTDPIILSHSIINDQSKSPVSARSISEGHAKMISSTGGVIGMWPSGYSLSFDEFVDRTFRMIDVVGIDHVGIGTDMDANFKPVISNYGEFIDWKMALQNRGLDADEVNKLAGANMYRVLREVT